MTIQQQSPPVVTGEPAAVAEQPHYNYRAAAAVGFIAGVVAVLIAGRFLLKLLGASAESSFVNLIYGISSPLVAPFHGIFPSSGSAANSFEPGALVAIAAYAVVGWGAVVLIKITTAPRGSRPAA